MEKNFLRSKIIILLIAIITAILSLSIGILGANKQEENKNKDKNAAHGAKHYYLYDDNEIRFDGLVIYLNATRFASGATVGNDKVTFNVGGWYDIGDASVTSCEVSNDNGYTLFKQFKSNGEFSVSSRHIEVKGWPLKNQSYEETTTYTIDFGLETFSLNGSITITVGGTQYRKTNHWSSGLSYSKASNYESVLRQDSYSDIHIENGDGLKVLAHEIIKGDCDNYIYLTNWTKTYLNRDVYMSSVSNMSSIGTAAVPFRGYFYGNGHTIYGLTVKLFDYIESLYLDDLRIESMTTTHCAPLAFYANNITIKNVYISNLVFNYSIGSGDAVIGGLISICNGDTLIQNCRIDIGGTVKQTPSSGDSSSNICSGGIVGQSLGTTKIQGCFVDWNCSVKAGYNMYFGGVCGLASSGTITIYNTLVYLRGGEISNGYYTKTYSSTHSVGTHAWEGLAEYYALSNSCSVDNYTRVCYGETVFKKLICTRNNRVTISRPENHYSYTVETDTNSLVKQGDIFNDNEW